MVKIGFIGAGRVGSTCTYNLLNTIDCDEMAIVDILGDLATGEAMDLETVAMALNKNIKIEGGTDYSLLKDSDVLVITAGVARKPGMTRLDLTMVNTKIIRSIMDQVMQITPGSIIVLVTNPLDLMVYVAQKTSEKPREEILGMGSLHDTVRLVNQIKSMGATKSEVLMIAEHGDSMFPLKSQAKIEGISPDWDNIIKLVRERGIEIIKLKGATTYTPATCASLMVQAIIGDWKKELPVSIVLQGEYGLQNVALGVPCIIGQHGLVKVVEYDLTEEEQEQLENSANVLKSMIKNLAL